tara:strand:- start:224 stop:409 length:186 start_codon:yes stop_codon:yes gene_type:complete
VFQKKYAPFNETSRFSRRLAEQTIPFLANKYSEDKSGWLRVAGFDASFDESAPTISILPKI